MIEINQIKYITLYQKISYFSEIPESEWFVFESLLVRKEYEKGLLFIQQGKNVSEMGFVLSGYFRQFFTLPNAKEVNHMFNFENQLVSDYESFVEGGLARLSIVAMEPAQILTITTKQFKSLFDRHKCWEKLGRRLAERYYIDKLNRERALLYMTPIERYNHLLSLKENDFVNRVPQYHIANFLSLTPEGLSRILKKK